MAMQFRNREDTRRYAAAEDAFTSEGGYLARDNDVAESDSEPSHKGLHMFRDFDWTGGRYAVGMNAVLEAFRNEVRHRV